MPYPWNPYLNGENHVRYDNYKPTRDLVQTASQLPAEWLQNAKTKLTQYLFSGCHSGAQYTSMTTMTTPQGQPFGIVL